MQARPSSSKGPGSVDGTIGGESAYSTGSLARYPSRAITEYFTGLCFSSCIWSGLPSLSTSMTLILR